MDKKATGVYKILNKVNGRFYIGSSIGSFQKRWREHITTLSRGKHRNKELQMDWDKFGENNFEFSIIDVIYVESEMLEREGELLRIAFDGGNYCYNLTPHAVVGGGRKVASENRGATSTEKQNTRKAQMTAAAVRDGILKDGKVSWSFAITMWIRGKARMVWVDEPEAGPVITLPVIITGEAHIA